MQQANKYIFGIKQPTYNETGAIIGETWVSDPSLRLEVADNLGNSVSILQVNIDSGFDSYLLMNDSCIKVLKGSSVFKTAKFTSVASKDISVKHLSPVSFKIFDSKDVCLGRIFLPFLSVVTNKTGLPLLGLPLMQLLAFSFNPDLTVVYTHKRYDYEILFSSPILPKEELKEILGKKEKEKKKECFIC